MPLLEPVIWAKGTVLNPQHLQIQDRFLVDSLQFQLQPLNFRPWGFRRLRIDQLPGHADLAGTIARELKHDELAEKLWAESARLVNL